MRVVIALGGNALLKRGEPMTAEVQRRNVQRAAQALAPLACQHQLIISHGNGPQVGLLALQAAAYLRSRRIRSMCWGHRPRG
jgi:carbamate kinase